MLNLIGLSINEIILLFSAEILLFLYYLKIGYKLKKALFWCLVFIPIFYFSINMLTEAVTADEPTYERCIVDVRCIKYIGKAKAVLYEYKLFQLTIGTIFLFIPQSIKTLLGDVGIWALYKIVHWLLIFFVCIAIAYVWKKDILIDKNERKNEIAENAILALLIGLPLSCLLFKVTNYDAGSTYPAILGISLIWGAYNKNNNIEALIGTLIVALGVFDKWTALPYWIISVVLFSQVVNKNECKIKNKIRNSIVAISISFVSAICLSALYYLFAYFQQAGFYTNIDLGVICFSFTHAIKSVFTGDLSVYSSNLDILYLFILFLAVFACDSFLNLLKDFCFKNKVSSFYLKTDFIVLILGFAIGIIAAYYLPLKISPFITIKNGEYLTTDSFDGWTYHFGANNGFTHFLFKIAYMFATIVTNYPFVIIILLVYAFVAILNDKKFNENYFPSLILSSVLVTLFIYLIAGLPYDARYYSFPMLTIPCILIFLIYKYDNFDKIKKFIIYIGLVIYVIEMIIYIPNIKSFSPIWLWHSSEWNNTVRKGEIYAGESMLWGEDAAIAGNIIVEDAKSKKIDLSEITIYDDYGSLWVNDYNLSIVNDSDKINYNKNTYIVLNKFKLFRDDVPNFIYEVKPLYVISYKGEIATYIYTGNQLKEYSYYFKME